jgi:hypothetical protein
MSSGVNGNSGVYASVDKKSAMYQLLKALYSHNFGNLASIHAGGVTRPKLHIGNSKDNQNNDESRSAPKGAARRRGRFICL